MHPNCDLVLPAMLEDWLVENRQEDVQPVEHQLADRAAEVLEEEVRPVEVLLEVIPLEGDQVVLVVLVVDQEGQVEEGSEAVRQMARTEQTLPQREGCLIAQWEEQQQWRHNAAECSVPDAAARDTEGLSAVRL